MKVHIFFILFLLTSHFLFGEINVEISFPDTFLENLSDDYESLLLSQVNYFNASELEPLVSNMLVKPHVTYSLSQSLGISTTLPQAACSFREERGELFLGFDGTVVSPTYNRDSLTSYLETLSIESDPYLGAGVQAWEGGFVFPLNRWVKRLSVNGTGGLLNYRQDDLKINNYSFQVNLQYAPFSSIRLHRAIEWSPLTLSEGGGYRYQEILIKPDMGVISQSFEIDPDGSGPLPSQSVDLEAVSRFYLNVTSDALTFPLQISTELRFFRTFRLALGGSLVPALTSSGIGLEGDGEVYFLGYEADILGITEADYGTITASGSVEGERGDTLSGTGWLRLQIDMGQLFFSLPVLFQPPDRLGAGAFLGVTL